MNLVRLVLFITALLWHISIAVAAPSKFVYQGQIIKPNGQPLESANVEFIVEIFSPGGEQCLLYQERHTLNLVNSNGLFSLTVGEGTRTGSDFEDTSTLNQAFNNFIGTISSATCAAVGTYTPAQADSRRLRIKFDNGNGLVTIPQDQWIHSVPFAQQASSIDGITSSELLRTNETGTLVLNQTNLEQVFDGPNFTELIDLINGTSTQYMSSGAFSAALDLNSQKIENLANPSIGTDATNKNYVDQNFGGSELDLTGLADGQTLVWNATGSKWEVQTVSSSDSTKLPLAGGQMSGDIDMNGNAITNATNIGASNNVTVGNDLTVTNDATVTQNLSVGNNLSISGGIGLAGGMNSASHIQLEDSSELRLGDADNSHYVGFKAPALVTAGTSFVWELPSADGTNGQLLQTNGSGVLSWVNPTSGADDLGNHTATANLQLNDNWLSNDGDAEGIRIDDDGNVGVGISGPFTEKLTVGGQILSEAEDWSGLITQVASSDIGFGSTTKYGALNLHKARGTLATPTGVNQQDWLGAITWRGHNGTDYVQSAVIHAEATENWTGSGRGSKLIFKTTNVGIEANPSPVLTLMEGNAGFGVDSPARRLHVNGAIRLNATTTPLTPTAGDMFIDSADSNILKWYDGSAWQEAGGGVGVESDPKMQTLSATEVDQLENIDAVTISNAQWGYLGNMSAQPLETVTGTVLDNVFSSNGLLKRTGAGTYVTVTDDSANWDAAFGWGDHSGAGYAADSAVFKHNGTVAMTGNIDANNNSILNLEGGSAAAPSISFNGDDNTGIFSPAGDSISISTAGIAALTVNSSGNVGIGTTTPAVELDVNTGTINAASICDENNANCLDLSAGIGASPGGSGSSANNLSIQFNEAGSFDGNSNFTYDRLNHRINLGDDTSGTNSAIYFKTSGSDPSIRGTASDFTLGFGATYYSKLTSTGFFGLNVTASNDALHVHHPTSSYSNLRLTNNITGSSTTDGLALYMDHLSKATISNHEAGPLVLKTSNLERIRIDSSGNVGIGTTNPTRPLHVNGAMRMTASTTPAGAATGDLFIDSADSNKLKWYDGSTWQEAGGGSVVETDPKMQTLSATEVDQLENIDAVTISNAQWGYLGNMSAQPLETVTGTVLDNVFSSNGLLKRTGAGTYVSVTDNSSNWDAAFGWGDHSGAGYAADSAVFKHNGTVAMTGNINANDNSILNLEAGSAAAPSISFNGDDNTGIFSPAPDSFSISTAGNEALTINSSGNVGIGTSSPDELLHLLSSTSSSIFKIEADPSNSNENHNPYIHFSQDGGNTYSYIGHGGDSGNAFGGSLTGSIDNAFIINALGNGIQFATEDIARMTVAQDGNVGIGTNDPSKNLEVSAADTNTEVRVVNRSSTSTHGPKVSIRNYSGGFGGYPFLSLLNSRGSESSTSAIQNNDALGSFEFVGVYNTAGGYSTAADVRGESEGNFSATSTPGRIIFRTTANSSTSPTERMRIDSNGNVGIGTNDPTAKLDVNGTVKATSFEGALTSSNLSVADGSAATPSMTFSSDTNTGFYSSALDQIGVSVAGNNIFDFSSTGLSSPTTGGASVRTTNGTASNPTFSFSGDEDTGWFRPSADTLAASTGGTERMRLTSSGNVGIGTNAPGFKLHAQSSSTQTSAGNIATTFNYLYVDPSASSAATFIGQYNGVENGGATAAITGEIVGQSSYSKQNSTSALNKLSGSWSGAEVQNTGTVTTAVGAQGEVKNLFTGTITEAMGLHSRVTNSGGGSITNGYGVYIDQVQGSNRWSLYANDSAPSYLGGKLGIGSTNPYFDLEVTRNDAHATIRTMNTGGSTTRYPAMVVQNYIDSAGSGWPEFYGVTSRGTLGSPQVTESGDVLVSFMGKGTYNTSYDASASSVIYMTATETFNATNRGANMTFLTTTNGESAPTERMRIDHNGFIGIGTTTPTFALDVAANSTGFGVRSHTTAANVSNLGIRSDTSPTHTANGTYHDQAIAVNVGAKASSGVTNSGTSYGIAVNNMRNWGTTDDNGALASQIGIYTAYGHYNSDVAATPSTTTATGLYVVPYSRTGTITNMYDIYLAPPGTGGTVTNRWGIFQDNTSKNYFGGNVGIGTSSPWAKLQVRDTDSDVRIAIQNTNSTADRYPGVLIDNYMGSVGLGYPVFTMANNRGNISSTLVIQSGDTLGGFNFAGSTDTSGGDGVGAEITAVASQTFSPTALGTDLVFWTSNLNSSSLSEKMRLKANGNFGIGTTNPSHILHITGQGRSTNSSWATTSDIRLKDVQGEYSYGLNEILNIPTYRFKYKKGNEYDLPTDKEFIGTVAQELQQAIPEAVEEDQNGYLTVNTDPVFWATINAVQELHGMCKMSNEQMAQIKSKDQEQDRKIASLEEENAKKDKEIEDLKRRLDTLEKLIQNK